MESRILIYLKNQQGLSQLIEKFNEKLEDAVFVMTSEGLYSQLAEFDESIQCLLVTDDLEKSHLQKVHQDLKAVLILIAYTNQPYSEIIDTIQLFQIRHVLLRGSKEIPDFQNLSTTLEKLSTNDIWGIEKYVENRDQIKQWTECDSEKRKDVYNAINDLIEPVSTNPKLQRAIEKVLEELLSNAFYNAPIDDDGIHPFACDDRTHPVVLPPEKAVDIKCAIQQNALVCSVRDLYGSFDDRKLIQALKNYLENNTSPQKGPGGAGLGLSIILKHSSYWVVNIAPGMCTEMIIWVSLEPKFSKRPKPPQSINIFLSPNYSP